MPNIRGQSEIRSIAIYSRIQSGTQLYPGKSRNAMLVTVKASRIFKFCRTATGQCMKSMQQRIP